MTGLLVSSLALPVAAARSAILGTGVAVFSNKGHAVVVAAKRSHNGAVSRRRTLFKLSAASATATAAVRTTLLAGAVGLANAASTGVAGGTRRTGAAGTTAAIRPALLSVALRGADGDALPCPRAILGRLANPTHAAAPVGTALFPIATGNTTGHALPGSRTGGSSGATAAASAAAICTTLFSVAIGDADIAFAATEGGYFRHADVIPVGLTAEGILGTDTGGHTWVLASRLIVGFAAIALAHPAILGTVHAALFGLFTQSVPAHRADGLAEATGTLGAGPACTTTATATVASALFIQAAGDAHTLEQVVALVSEGALPAGSTAAVVATLFALAGSHAIAVAEFVAEVSGGATAAGAAASIGTTLFASALRGAISATVVFVTAFAVPDGLPRAFLWRLGSADIDDAFPDLDVLTLGFGARLIPASVGACLVPIGAIPRAIQQGLAIPGGLAGASEARFVGAAKSADAVAAIGTTLFPLAIDDARGFAHSALADEAGWAGSTGATTTVGSTLFAEARREARLGALPVLADASRSASAAGATAAIRAAFLVESVCSHAVGNTATGSKFGAHFDAEGVPHRLAAPGGHLAHEFFTRTAVASGVGSFHATVAARTTVHGAGDAALSFVVGTFVVTTQRADLEAEALIGTFVAWLALTTRTATAVASALLICATGNARWNALAGLAGLVCSTSSAGSSAAIGAALFPLALRGAGEFALVVLAVVPVGACATGAVAAIWTAHFSETIGVTVGALVVFVDTLVVHGLEHARSVEVHPAHTQNALSEPEELVLCLWGSLVQAVEDTCNSRRGHAVEGTGNQGVTGQSGEALVVLAGCSVAANSTDASASVRATFFALALGGTDREARSLFALLGIVAFSAGAATAIRSAILAVTLRHTSATAALEAQLHAEVVPGATTTVGSLSANTILTRAGVATRVEGRLATGGALSTVADAVLARLAVATDVIPAVAIGNALTVGRASLCRPAVSTNSAAPIWAAFG